MCFVCMLACSVIQLCPTLCDPMELWDFADKDIGVGCLFLPTQGSSHPRDWTHISCVSRTGRQILCHWATWGFPLRFESECKHKPRTSCNYNTCESTLQLQQRTDIIPQLFPYHSRHRLRTGTQVSKPTGSSHLFDSKTEFILGFILLESIVMIKAGHPWESEDEVWVLPSKASTTHLWRHCSQSSVCSQHEAEWFMNKISCVDTITVVAQKSNMKDATNLKTLIPSITISLGSWE